MKKLILITSIVFASTILWQGCTKTEETGTIYGTVTDFDTGEPVKNANVKLMPNGETTLTGSDGTYMFQDLKNGDYSLSLSKAEYEDLNDDYVIQVTAGKKVRRDVQMKKKVALMRITDMDGNDVPDLDGNGIPDLDFGEDGDDVSRIFNIFNDSGVTLQYEITTTANWIQKPVDGASGTVQAGETKGIVVVIDRSKLQQGNNTTTMHITSNTGNQQLTIKAKRVDITTLEATEVNDNSTVLNGKINTNIQYSEKGFYYGTNHSLNNKVIVNGNGTGAFSAQITGLSTNATYYFKAYCIYNSECLYGEEKSFQATHIPTFEYNGHTYWVAPSPSTQVSDFMSWDMANNYCENLTAYGFSDWRMPTLSELQMMYQFRESIGGWLQQYTSASDVPCYHVYWTSSYTNFYYTYYSVSWDSGDWYASNDLEQYGYECGYFSNDDDYYLCLLAHVRPIRLDH